MKNLQKKWIFIAQFHFQDPDPDSEYGSGSSMAIWIRIQPDPDPKQCFPGMYCFLLALSKNRLIRYRTVPGNICLKWDGNTDPS